MPFKSLLKSDATARYVNQIIFRDSELKRRLREQTAKLPNGQMQISPDQGAFLAMLAKAINAKRALEIGTFTGYSALCVAEALPPDGKLIACDVSDEWTSIGKQYWREAGLADKIELRLGPAVGTLQKLIDTENSAGTFDFAFIDADKDAYPQYYELTLRLLRPGGLLAMDNVLGNTSGDPVTHDPTQTRFHPLNEKIRDDDRVDPMIATIGAGLMLARKR